MTTDTDARAARASRFRALHEGPRMLVLPNAWDVVTARLFEECGFAAVGTTSFGIARAHGFRDGDNAAFAVTLAMVGRMAAALSVPLSADIEGGYGETPAAVAEHARQLIDAGVVGFNVEDGQGQAAFPLADVSLQCDRIAALRDAGLRARVPVFVNARTDVFWLRTHTGDAALEEATRRAAAYVRAGADGVFIPGLVDAGEIGRAVRAVGAPLNVLASPRTPPAASSRPWA